MTIPGLGASWKTSLVGVGVLGATAAQQVVTEHGVPQTSDDWLSFLINIIIGIGLLFAKDRNVSNAQMPGEAKQVG